MGRIILNRNSFFLSMDVIRQLQEILMGTATLILPAFLFLRIILSNPKKDLSISRIAAISTSIPLAYLRPLAEDGLPCKLVTWMGTESPILCSEILL